MTLKDNILWRIKILGCIYLKKAVDSMLLCLELTNLRIFIMTLNPGVGQNFKYGLSAKKKHKSITSPYIGPS